MTSPVKLTRRVTFSSGHRYWDSNLSPDENRVRYGKWASPYNHGHNYVLWVTTIGHVNPANGMVVNIKVIDDLLQREVVQLLDQKSLNDEVAYFLDQSSSLENLLGYLRGQLKDLPPEAKLTHLKLEETPLLYAEWSAENPTMITLTRTYEFAASHRLHSPNLSDAENIELFGKCNNLRGHGHNYILEVSVTGEPDPQTGMIASLEAIDQVVHDEIVDRYDHKNLNEDVPEFAGINTTSENVALEIFRRLEPVVPAKLARIRLHETARNIFEVSA